MSHGYDAEEEVIKLEQKLQSQTKEIERLQKEITNLLEFIKEHDMDESLQEWNNCN
jgi:cell division protein FtsL